MSCDSISCLGFRRVAWESQMDSVCVWVVLTGEVPLQKSQINSVCVCVCVCVCHGHRAGSTPEESELNRVCVQCDRAGSTPEKVFLDGEGGGGGETQETIPDQCTKADSLALI
ncbi:unnamed protein product [Arctogadus glacialis]